jgi:hypothetical protein
MGVARTKTRLLDTLARGFRSAVVWILDPKPEFAEYLNPPERLRYAINQYRCSDMRALKEKILQFPAASEFIFSSDFSGVDRAELVEISDFLWTHGYKVNNMQNWIFLRPPTPLLVP